MNIDHLRTFLEVAAVGSFHRAAERLNVTQSTVSARIKALEERLDRALFVRLRNGVEPTGAGRRLRRHADTAVRAWERGRQTVALPEDLRAVFGLGVQAGLWERLGPEWVAWMRAAAPDVAVNVEADYSDPMMRRIGDGLLDMALMFAPRTQPGLVIEELLAEEVVLVSTRPRDVGSGWLEDYVFVNWTYGFRAAHSQAYPEMETPAVTVGLPWMALSHILAHGGAAYLSRRVVAPFVAERRLFPVEGAPAFRVPAFLVYPAQPDEPELQALAIEGLRRNVGEGA